MNVLYGPGFLFLLFDVLFLGGGFRRLICFGVYRGLKWTRRGGHWFCYLGPSMQLRSGQFTL